MSNLKLVYSAPSPLEKAQQLADKIRKEHLIRQIIEAAHNSSPIRINFSKPKLIISND